jgi:hypothetical protein
MATGEIPGTLQWTEPVSKDLEDRSGRHTSTRRSRIVAQPSRGADDARQMTLRCDGRMGQSDAHADASGHRYTWQTRYF